PGRGPGVDPPGAHRLGASLEADPVRPADSRPRWRRIYATSCAEIARGGGGSTPRRGTGWRRSRPRSRKSRPRAGEESTHYLSMYLSRDLPRNRGGCAVAPRRTPSTSSGRGLGDRGWGRGPPRGAPAPPRIRPHGGPVGP